MGVTPHSSKSAVTPAVVGGKFATVIGVILVALFVIATSGEIPSKDDDTATKISYIVVYIIFILVGIFLIIYGNKAKHRIRRFRQYIDIITNQNQTSIDQVAGIVQKPVNFVLADIQNMIRRRYFVGAYVDVNTRYIVFQGRSAGAGAAGMEENAPPNREMVVVACKSCGANNQIVKGTVGECEYCGSPIE
jgi:NADH:ubiquinone oxidoreductase subunit 5 (subunit L)/multisubunit Na+/H+ antiporter MnhA subunit